MSSGISSLDERLRRALCDHPRQFDCRFTTEARSSLLDTLFRALTNDNAEYLRVLFPNGFPASYRLQDAQEADQEPEYSAAAKGTLCGHIFKPNEVTYHCETCTDDPTAVLCARCFAASDHEDHQLNISISSGNSGCCDCGDHEAWKRPVHCAIHTATDDFQNTDAYVSALPQDLQESVRTTIARVLDYFCDVIGCSPEHLRLPKSIESIKEDEERSRLSSQYYVSEDDEEANPEFCLLIWNDEKHTVREVRDQVARACGERMQFGLNKANQANDVGRSLVRHSRDLRELVKMAKVIEQIKITVTIRSSRDTYREEMCGAIIDWLGDVAGCSIGGDHHILRNTVCEELLQVWRVGSQAPNARTGRQSIDDHGLRQSRDDHRTVRRRWALTVDPIQLVLQPALVQQLETAMSDDSDAEDGADEELINVGEDEQGNTILQTTRIEVAHPAELVDERMGDPEATDDADEMDTDGDNEFLDVAERIEADQPSPPVEDSFATEIAATPTPQRPTEIPRPSEGNVNYMHIPKRSELAPGPIQEGPHAFWLMPTPEQDAIEELPVHEDLKKSIRLDYMIIYDLRLWKTARIGLRDLYISTVVKIPSFKRILGLRFSSLYTALAQLYLIADREPDHSIVNLSLQILTTPSICQERIEKGNFLTNIMAILYTFLTNRQVGLPEDVDPAATLSFDPGAVANRRLFHFFSDLRYFLATEHVQAKVRSDVRYISQYLDLMKLLQGICPNIRAVGEHVEYETDTWISASVLTRESNKLCRVFAETYQYGPIASKHDEICAAVAVAAGMTIMNCFGIERNRFEQNEIKNLVEFQQTTHKVVKFSVARGALSFHHPLHYTLSWLMEIGKDSARTVQALQMSAQHVANTLRDAPLNQDASLKTSIASPEDALIVMFDYPLRVCAWLAQMKANMWVRNGMSLRHQMGQYKSVPYRDVAHQRDLFLLQTALVACDPARVLASMVDRFGLTGWMSSDYESLADCDDVQMVDLTEDLIYLLINLLSDRDTLTSACDDPDSSLTTVRKEIAHSLCFKPLSYSDLTARLTERVQDHEKLQEVLETMTRYRPPEGLHDTGLFELKEEYLSELDPYNSHFSKNQRDEAENIYKKWLGKKLKKHPEDVVLEPKLHSITSEGYVKLPAVCETNVFSEIIFRCLLFVAEGYKTRTGIKETRAESLLQSVLQLALIATLEDHSGENSSGTEHSSFVFKASSLSFTGKGASTSTVVKVLHRIWLMDDYSACRGKIRHILRLFNQKRPALFGVATRGLEFPSGRFDTASPANVESEIEAKKRQALERKAKIMAQFQQQQQSFLDKQVGYEWEDEELQSPEAELPTSTESRHWKFPSGLCIQCREDTSDVKLYGTFAMITDAHIIRETQAQDVDFVREVLESPQDLDRTLAREKPFGVAGSNHKMVSQMDSFGNEVQVERQGISKGWPRGATAKGPLTSSCGHIMHFSCFEGYYQSVVRRHAAQVARQHPERVTAQEFVCPLCKALANTFLPIVWKSTEQSYPAALNVRAPFTQFMDEELDTLSRCYDIDDRGFMESVTQMHKQNLSSFANSALEAAVERAQAEAVASPSMVSWSERPEMAPISELAGVYLRLKGPLNILARVTHPGVFPAKFHDNEQPNSFNLLMDSLANTIAATEIAYRGREAEFGTTLLSGIPQQTLSHLQILASTTKSYAATCHILVRGAIDEHFQQVYLSLFRKLFAQTRATEDISFLEKIFLASLDLPLLRMDPFTYLVQATLVLCPVLKMDYRHMLQLALTAEILRVIIAYVNEPDGLLANTSELLGDPSESQNETAVHVYKQALIWLNSELQHEGLSLIEQTAFERFKTSAHQNSVLALERIVDRYVLAFLRKAAIFFHVSLGVDFPTTVGSEASLPEAARLLHFMQLPSATEILSGLNEYAPSGGTKKLVSCWLKDLWAFRYQEVNEKEHISRFEFDVRGAELIKPPTAAYGIRILHPTPLELIGLPKYYDVLLELTSRRKCPKTGKELSDPALCLFCGDIFCAQSVCCQTSDGRGGCNAHVEKCSAPIGMFLFVRKCNVVLLHAMRDPNQSHPPSAVLVGSNVLLRTTDAPPLGSFFPAPYLTKHGETDGGLRNKHQLMLSQMRYDRMLRDAWLMVNGTVWSAVARKLEGEVNSGGWETL